MTVQVSVRLTDLDLAALDAAIARGRFANRSEALRAGLDLTALMIALDLEQPSDEPAYTRYGAKHGAGKPAPWTSPLADSAQA